MRNERLKGGRAGQSGTLADATALGLDVAPSCGQPKPDVSGDNSAIAAGETCDGPHLEGTVRTTGRAPNDPRSCCGYVTIDPAEEGDDAAASSGTGPDARRTDRTLPSGGAGVLDSSVEICESVGPWNDDLCLVPQIKGARQAPTGLAASPPSERRLRVRGTVSPMEVPR